MPSFLILVYEYINSSFAEARIHTALDEWADGIKCVIGSKLFSNEL